MLTAVLDNLRSAVEIIYPLSCAGCAAPGAVLCSECIGSFRPVDPATSCPRCGMDIGLPDVCGACTVHPPRFERGWYGFYFEGALREALLAFKFRKRRDAGRSLVRLLAPRLESITEDADVMLPVPVTEKRLRERGFNQCYSIAEEIGRITGKPLDGSALYKKKETQDQYTLSREERRKNVRGAFGVRASRMVRGKRVLLIDDLMTTGHTLSEASRTLLSAGAQSVTVFALARTP